ncbi:MAG TPA: 16S rRNA (adenine(1518)-N(6)/adenine(1519)-N(6))-dimethyltransferase RsmA [Methylocella sp.]|nr:16S rRNA (adenine(1518)-N(6)/adenine(1519)-N(6))-dimethyltransferase RsmA [Methylocella sp.]
MRRHPGQPKAAKPQNGLPPLRDVVAAHGLSPRQSLGQNFLFDLNLTRRIARAAGPLGEATVIETGAGPGGLTRALLAEGAHKVIAIERDRRFIPALSEIAAHYPGRLHVIEGNALAIDYPALAAGSAVTRVCANLPYNIGTELLILWLETEPWPPWYDRLILMFQREVAERIVATPAERSAYGRLSVLCNWRCMTRILFDVPPAAFTPRPKVKSSLVELVPRSAPLPCDSKLMPEVTQAAFGQRRKMLRQSLKALAGCEPGELLRIADIDPALRAEEVGIEGYAALARALAACRKQAARPG